MTLSAKALTTLETLKGDLGVTTTDEDTYLERLIEASSARVAAMCGRALHYEASIVERVAGFGGKTLRVERPIVALTSIEFEEMSGTMTTIPSTDYTIEDAERGEIRHRAGLWRWTCQGAGALGDPLPGTELKLYSVTYEGGYVLAADATRTLPYEIEEAVLALCVEAYNGRGRSSNVASEKILSESVTYRTVKEAERVLGGTLADVLRPYTRGGFA